MRFGITVSFATLAIVLATGQQGDENAVHNSLVTRQNKPPSGGAGGGDTKLQGDPKTCTAILKMIEGCKPGGRAPPKTRRHLSSSNGYPLTRRAPPSGDSKAGAAASDSCSKLDAMAKKTPGSGSPPKPKGPSSSPSTVSVDDTFKAPPSRRDSIYNVEHNSLFTRQTKPPSSASGGPDAKLTGDPKTCTAIIKMIEGCKSAGGATPKTRRHLSRSDDHPLTRRAPPSGDIKAGAGPAAADPCSKLQAMAAKKPQGSGSPPKPKAGSTAIEITN